MKRFEVIVLVLFAVNVIFQIIAVSKGANVSGLLGWSCATICQAQLVFGR